MLCYTGICSIESQIATTVNVSQTIYLTGKAVLHSHIKSLYA